MMMYFSVANSDLWIFAVTFKVVFICNLGVLPCYFAFFFELDASFLICSIMFLFSAYNSLLYMDQIKLFKNGLSLIFLRTSMLWKKVVYVIVDTRDLIPDLLLSMLDGRRISLILSRVKWCGFFLDLTCNVHVWLLCPEFEGLAQWKCKCERYAELYN